MRPWKYENRRSSKEWKEIGTSASLAGRCCNGDNRIINVSNKFEKLWYAVWMCLLFYWSLLLFILSALIRKQEQRVVLDGSKIIRIVLLWKRAIDTVDIFHEVQTRRKGFLLSVSRCGISRRQAHVRGVTRWEAVILNYQCSIRREFPVWQNRRYSSLAALMWQLWTKTITKHIPNWTRDFVKLIVENHCLPNTSYGVLRKPCI